MNRNESVENFVKGLFGSIDLHNYTYEDLCRVAAQWVEFAEQQSLAPDPGTASVKGVQLDRLARLFTKRHFAGFRARINARTSLEVALVELFLLSRIRTYVLAYLSVQEGEDFEGAASYETPVPKFIAQLLRYLGKQSYCTFNPGYSWLRLRIDIDPLVHLRKIYGLLLLGQRRGRKLSLVARASIAIHKLAFSVKSRLVGMIVRVGTRKLTNRDPVSGIAALLRTPEVRRSLAIAILILFPSARELTERDWLGLLRRIEEYFAPRIADLLEAMPEHSVANHGLIKLCKVAFGTIAGRTAVRDVHEKDNIEFIFNTLRLAYSWGVTYPLVDNVLDSAATSARVRNQLTDVLTALFAGHVAHDQEECDNVSVREVYRRLAEVISLVPPDRLPQARRTLGHLLESHRRDAKRRLSTVASEVEGDTKTQVMVDTALKSALVRLATMEVCGIPVDEETLARGLVRSLFNQLGDDLWDIYEDFDDDRVTPFTLYLTRGGPLSPFDFYLDYSVLLARGLSRRRQTAVFMGFRETLRDSLLALEDRKEDHLGVAQEIARTLERSAEASGSDLVRDVPHVDFDAVLFAFETALLDLASRH